MGGTGKEEGMDNVKKVLFLTDTINLYKMGKYEPVTPN